MDKTLDYIMSLDVNTIIPGHGPLSGKKDISDMRKYLITFDKKAKELCAKSKDVDRIVSEIKKALPQRRELDMLIKANIQQTLFRGHSIALIPLSVI